VLLQQLLKKPTKWEALPRKKGGAHPKKPAGVGSQKKELLPAPLPCFSFRRRYIIKEAVGGAIFQPNMHGAIYKVLLIIIRRKLFS
jgi:hypothetical protein